MFYLYHQNNSGGSFGGPAIYVVVEADTPQEANTIAEANGVYFNGVNNGRDCECCGDRWYSMWEGDTEPDGYHVVATEEEVVEITNQSKSWAEMDTVPALLLIKKVSQNGKEN